MEVPSIDQFIDIFFSCTCFTLSRDRRGYKWDSQDVFHYCRLLGHSALCCWVLL